MLVITNYLIIKLQILELFVNINWQCVGPVATYSGKLSLIFNSLCVKGVRIGSFSGPYFPTFGLNTERYSVSLRIQSKCRAIRTRKTPNTDTFHAVHAFIKLIISISRIDISHIFWISRIIFLVTMSSLSNSFV